MSELSVTIKYGKGFEESWAVFRADSAAEMRKDLVGYFGIAEDAVEGLSLHEVTLMATSIAHGSATVASILGGKPIAETGTQAQGTTWAAAEPEVKVDPNVALIEELRAAETTDQLRALWVANQDAFEDDAVIAAYSERGRSLTGAGAGS